MGSLASRPKVPRAASSPQIVYVPQPNSSPPSTGGTSSATTNEGASTNTGSNENAAQTGGEAPKEVRENNLLRRSRGRLSTVVTGFKGILSDTTSRQRKSLLGE